MRIWSIHPRYLDVKGLVALWRETLLAQAVLMNLTKGYKNHPQLNRFKKCKDPIGVIGTYLKQVLLEAKVRGYNFSEDKIIRYSEEKVNVTDEQVVYEFKHFMKKLKVRDNDRFNFLNLRRSDGIYIHPSFHLIDGEIEDWEKRTNYESEIEDWKKRITRN